MLRWLSEHPALRAYQRFVITFRDNPAAVANNRGAIANARRHDRLAQHVGKAFAIYRTERGYIDCRINQLDVRSRTKQNNAAPEIESPRQLDQRRIFGTQSVAAEKKFGILLVLLEV